MNIKYNLEQEHHNNYSWYRKISGKIFADFCSGRKKSPTSPGLAGAPARQVGTPATGKAETASRGKGVEM